MIVNFSWVIPGRLAGFGLHGEPTLSELQSLRKQGLGALVTLTEMALPAELMLEAQIPYRHLPVPDMQAPSLVQIGQFIEFVDQAWTDNLATAVHCLAGLGRTGTMIACYLVHQGHGAESALAQLRVHRPGSVETMTQEKAIHDFARSLNVLGQRV